MRDVTILVGKALIGIRIRPIDVIVLFLLN